MIRCDNFAGHAWRYGQGLACLTRDTRWAKGGIVMVLDFGERRFATPPSLQGGAASCLFGLPLVQPRKASRMRRGTRGGKLFQSTLSVLVRLASNFANCKKLQNWQVA